jgi:hypothetical protein
VNDVVVSIDRQLKVDERSITWIATAAAVASTKEKSVEEL